MWIFLGWRRSRVKSQHQRYQLSLHASTVDKRKIISKQADALLFNQFVLIPNAICLLSMSTVEARPLKKEQKPLILWDWREQVKSNQCQIHQWKWLPVCVVASFFSSPICITKQVRLWLGKNWWVVDFVKIEKFLEILLLGPRAPS